MAVAQAFPLEDVPGARRDHGSLAVVERRTQEMRQCPPRIGLRRRNLVEPIVDGVS